MPGPTKQQMKAADACQEAGTAIRSAEAAAKRAWQLAQNAVRQAIAAGINPEDIAVLIIPFEFSRGDPLNLSKEGKALVRKLVAAEVRSAAPDPA